MQRAPLGLPATLALLALEFRVRRVLLEQQERVCRDQKAMPELLARLA